MMTMHRGQPRCPFPVVHLRSVATERRYRCMTLGRVWRSRRRLPVCRPRRLRAPGPGGRSRRAATHTLVFAQPNISTPPELVAWAEEVQRLSDGSLTINYHDGWREGEPRYEQ